MLQVGISSANAYRTGFLSVFVCVNSCKRFIYFSLHLFEGFDDYLEVILSLMYLSPFIKRNHHSQQILHPHAFSLFAICFVLHEGNLRNYNKCVNMFIFHFELYLDWVEGFARTCLCSGLHVSFWLYCVFLGERGLIMLRCTAVSFEWRRKEYQSENIKPRSDELWILALCL